MARKQQQRSPSAEERRARFRLVRKWMLLVTTFSVLLVGLLLGWQETQRYLLQDTQFLLPPPVEPGEGSPNLTIEGVKNASRENLLLVFERDYGRSLYLLPVAERRLEILRSPWVAEASVSRRWPNRLKVVVTERVPVAWIQMSGRGGGDASRPALIDAEGNILPVETPGQFQLPVLAGIGPEFGPEERRLRVRRFLHLVKEAGDLSERISEVDVADPSNLKVMQDESGRIVTLILGDRQFKRRLERFRVSYPEIQKRAPEAAIFDLRIDGNVLSVPSAPGSAREQGMKGDRRGA